MAEVLKTAAKSTTAEGHVTSTTASGTRQPLDVTLYDAAGNAVTPTNIATGIAGGSKNVTTAGTRVALAASTTCKRVIITAKVTNTGIIWTGGSDVGALVGTPLYALDSIDIEIANLATVFIDSTVNGEGVTFTYYT